ncbi:outer membrane protein transport protein [Jannaschia sp. LMIT008]|uniref:outer membrane protein transport protein n=1 Tax=Jannaschia maritima TaxID=3032585 RepID=UPI002811B6DF|nr:hypothetical protein [Jannaschia sp. LMIT008]
MKKTAALATCAMLGTTALSHAGGLDRSMQSVLPLFDADGTVSVATTFAFPSLTGRDLNGDATYDAGENFTQTTVTYAGEVNDRFSFAVIGDQPFGLDLDYGNTPQSSALGGTTADLYGNALSVLGRYKITDRVSVFGGVRAQRAGGTINLNGVGYSRALGAGFAGRGLLQGIATTAANPNAALADRQAAGGILAGIDAANDQVGAVTALAGAIAGNPTNDPNVANLTNALNANTTLQGQFGAAQGSFANTASLPFPGLTGSTFLTNDGYNVDIDGDWGVGLTLGAAYEIPEIALRAVLTYHSEIIHETTATEAINFDGNDLSSSTGLTFETPQSINLELQSGVAEGTLVFGGVRWTDWDDFNVTPSLLSSNLANINDTYRWTLGVARQFTDSFVGVASLVYEEDQGSASQTPLGPTDGILGLSLGGRYETGALQISGGINYTKVGDAIVRAGSTPVAIFEGSDAIGVGLKVAYQF